MKKIKLIFAIAVFILLIPKLKMQGSLLFISENTKVSINEIFEHNYTEIEQSMHDFVLI